MTPATAARLVDGLGHAFAAGAVDAVLAEFCPDGDVLYAGSEASEVAVGHVALRALLEDLFTRDERYSWESDRVHVLSSGSAVALLADVTLLVHPYVDGVLGEVTERAPYRISGTLEPVGGSWRWRLCQGSEPTSG